MQLLAFGGGAGLFPLAPGTAGTLVAVPLVWLTYSFFDLTGYLACTLFLCVFGVVVCGSASRQLGVHDHKGIVWDEIAGYFITMIAVPLSWQTLLIGFLLFRFFDICKPWPIGAVDKKIKGGLGIMIDDILAGLVSLALLQLLQLLVYQTWLEKYLY